MENAADILGIIAIVILAGDRISKLTATKKDDAIFAIIYRVTTILGLRVLPSAADVAAMKGPDTRG